MRSRNANRLVMVIIMVSSILMTTPGNPSLAQQNKGQSAESQVDPPTLKETTDWLKDKLPKYVNQYQLLDKRLLKVDEVVFKECQLKFVETSTWDKPDKSGRFLIQTEVEIQLTEIDPSKIVELALEEHTFVVFETKDGKPSIKRRFRTPGARDRFEKTYFFPFRNADIAGKISKGLKHAVTLCQEGK